MKKRVERGHGSWGFLFPAMLVLVAVLWTLRITVITMEYKTTTLNATETDAAADADGLNGNAVGSAAGTDGAESDAETGGSADQSAASSGMMLLGAEANGSTVTYTACSCTFDAGTGNFTVELSLDFSLPQSELSTDYDSDLIASVSSLTYSKAYTISLPSDIIVPDSLLYADDGTTRGVYLGYESGTYEEAFRYYFTKNTDENGNVTYSVTMVFLDSFLGGLSGADVTGTMTMWGYVDSSSYSTEDGSLTISDGETDILKITNDLITFSGDGNETYSEDITVTKSGSYNAAAGTVTYTVTVYSKSGTGETITLTDCFTDANLSSILGNLVSVEYQTATIPISIYRGTDQTWYFTGSVSAQGTAVDIDEATSGDCYYYVNSDGELVVVLPGLSGDDTYVKGTSDSLTADAYILTYTYNVSPEAGASYSSANSVTATTEDTAANTTLTSAATASVYITGATLIRKSGSWDGSSSITWTITVGDGSACMDGYSLSDDMLASISAGDLKVTSGSASSGTAVTIYYRTDTTDSEGTVTFSYTDASGNEVEEKDLSGVYAVYVLDSAGAISEVLFYDTDSTGAQFFLTYTTKVDNVWASKYVTNEATIENGQGASYSATGSAWITGSGSNAFSKTLNSYSEQGDGTVILTWVSTYTVPETGIPAGTTFTDYVLSSSGSGVHSITLAQAKVIISELKAKWGESNLTNIQLSTNANVWNTLESDWVDASVVSALSDADSSVYYQFRFTVAEDIAYDTNDSSKNTISCYYSTTASVSGYDSNTYTNYLMDGSTTKSAGYTWYEKVVKYNVNSYGNIDSTDNLAVTTSDGTVSWVVRVVPGSSYNDSTVYTVVDTLPAGVTLSELSVSVSGSNYGYSDNLIADNSSNSTGQTTVSGMGAFTWTVTTEDQGTESTADDVQTVTLTATGLKSNSVSLLYIKYVCALDETAAATVNYTDDTKTEISSYVYSSLANSVAVTENGTGYGSDSTTSTVTWTQATQTETDSDLSKEAAFDSTNNILTYSVEINPDGKTWANSVTGEEYDSLTVVDVLSYNTYPGWGIARDASLLSNSVKLYYATKDANGNLVKGAEVSTSDYSWTCSETSNDYTTWEKITKTITLNVPNSVKLILEYQYLVTIIHDDSVYNSENEANVTNYAELYAGGELVESTSPVTSADEVEDSGTSASANGTAGYTIYKVDADNFSVRLSDAVYTLYVYSSTQGKFVRAGSFTTNSGGYISVSGTRTTGEDGNTYYAVTMSDGSSYSVPADTICYLVETQAPEYYKLDDTKYYFYFGSTIAAVASGCVGYSTDLASETVRNLITSYTKYVTNEHSSDYYAAKTSISVIKRWLDADGNEYTKTDGSISFTLYRVLILNDGTITSVSELTGASGGGSDDDDDDGDSGDSGDSGGSQEEGKVTVDWYIYEQSIQWYSAENRPYRNSGTQKITASADAPATVTISYYISGVPYFKSWNYYPTVTLSTGGTTMDSGYQTLVTFDYTGTANYTDENVVKAWLDVDACTYYVTLQITESVDLYFGTTSYSFYSYAISGDFSVETTGGSEETTAEETTTETAETTTSASGDEGGEAETEIYRLNLTEEFADNVIVDADGDGTIDDYEVNNFYGWTDEDSSHSAAGFFGICGRLSVNHGTVEYDLDGDGLVDTGETELSVCLKMESSYGTTVTFTTAKGGNLILVFNSEGTNTVKITDSSGASMAYYATNNILEQYLSAGTYTISYNRSCYVFYLAFEEGASDTGTSTSEYAHNFQESGTTSDFYTISGSTSNSYGTVSYGISSSLCLKMNSSAKITFTTEESGSIYLIFTNPKGAKKVGITVDGEEEYATVTTSVNSYGYLIYTLTARLEAGTHTITRISGTEVMLYYMEYTPDNYGGKSWETDAADTALAGLSESTASSYASNAEEYGTYTLSAADEWSWAKSNLPAEYVDTNTGEVLGYFLYYVVEETVTDEDGETAVFLTQYLNDDAIEGGSIGISNQINAESSGSTAVTVSKTWNPTLTTSGITDADTISALEAALTEMIDSASITYNLYAKMNLYSNVAEDDLSAGDSYSRSFTSVESDDFYSVGKGSAAASTSTNGGDVTYGAKTYSTALKMESATGVTFDAPAANGTLTLVFSTKNRTSSSGDAVLYGPSFKITHTADDGTESSILYFYDVSTDTLKYSGESGSEVSQSTDTYAIFWTYDTDANAVVFTLNLSEDGTYTVGRGTSECYLYYMDYAYQYRYLTDGVLTQTGTLAATAEGTTGEDENETGTTEEDESTTAASEEETTEKNEEGTGTVTWTKVISGLPLYIYNDAGDTRIGEYSYYVAETEITLSGTTWQLENLSYDSSTGTYEITYEQDGYTFTYLIGISYLTSEADSGNGGGSSSVTIAEDTVTSGTISVTNAVTLAVASAEEAPTETETETETETGTETETESYTYFLPETGGAGTGTGYGIGLLLIAVCAVGALARNGRRKQQSGENPEGETVLRR